MPFQPQKNKGCQNCGSLFHKKLNCLEKPGKKIIELANLEKRESPDTPSFKSTEDSKLTQKTDKRSQKSKLFEEKHDNWKNYVS